MFSFLFFSLFFFLILFLIVYLWVTVFPTLIISTSCILPIPIISYYRVLTYLFIPPFPLKIPVLYPHVWDRTLFIYTLFIYPPSPLKIRVLCPYVEKRCLPAPCLIISPSLLQKRLFTYLPFPQPISICVCLFAFIVFLLCTVHSFPTGFLTRFRRIQLFSRICFT
jgi:hypothetical protein